MCRLQHIALCMLRKACYRIFIVLAFLCENYANALQVDVYYYFEKGEKWGFLCAHALSLLNLTAEGFKIIDIRIPYIIDANC